MIQVFKDTRLYQSRYLADVMIHITIQSNCSSKWKQQYLHYYFALLYCFNVLCICYLYTRVENRKFL